MQCCIVDEGLRLKRQVSYNFCHRRPRNSERVTWAPRGDGASRHSGRSVMNECSTSFPRGWTHAIGLRKFALEHVLGSMTRVEGACQLQVHSKGRIFLNTIQMLEAMLETSGRNAFSEPPRSCAVYMEVANGVLAIVVQWSPTLAGFQLCIRLPGTSCMGHTGDCVRRNTTITPRDRLLAMLEICIGDESMSANFEATTTVTIARSRRSARTQWNSFHGE